MINRLGRAPLLFAERIDGSAASDRGQPRCKIPTCIEVIGMTPRLEKHVLRDVFGTLPVTQYPVGDGEYQPAESLVHRAHCVFVAVEEGKRKFGVTLYLVRRTELLHDRRQRIRSKRPNYGHARRESPGRVLDRKRQRPATPLVFRAELVVVVGMTGLEPGTSTVSW